MSNDLIILLIAYVVGTVSLSIVLGIIFKDSLITNLYLYYIPAITASIFVGYAAGVLGLTNFVNLSVLFTIAVSAILSNFFLINRILGKQILEPFHQLNLFK